MASPRHRERHSLRSRSVPAIVLLSALAACSQNDPSLSDSANRGRAVYLSFCVQCHHYYDPFQPGTQGPAVARASLELLEAKILRGTYPEGHEPAESTREMPIQPHLKARIPDLHAYLAEVAEPDGEGR